jgi:hypothetical protein
MTIPEIINDIPFACSQKLRRFMIRNKEKINKDDTQVIGVLSGLPGSGKSVRAQEFLYMTNPNTNITKIAFNKQEMIEGILNSRKEGVICDEGLAVFFSRGAMTKEGRLMAEIMGECRQRNLHLILCITDVLALDSFVLSMANYVCEVWESRKEINGRDVTIKGNMCIYPKFRHNNYKDRYLSYLKIRKGNPLLKVKRPRPWLTEAGSPYGEGFKGAFYAVPEQDYKEKKEAILKKYQKSLDHKQRNQNIDYPNMDRLIKAKVSAKRISELLNVAPVTVYTRKGFLKSHKRPKKR